jgi:hypothetical protein
LDVIISELQLANIFPTVGINSIRLQMTTYKNHFIPTAEQMQKLVEVIAQ